MVQFISVHPSGALPKGAPRAVGWTVLEDVLGQTHQTYSVDQNSPNLFVIRPDGYIGARVKSVTRVEEYFKAIVRL